ncbi:MAG: uroporphyrinogen-III C-methyltransferase [Saprospiraceae bacterium]|nr:uroporphyrinogen-III C-methyltransferase [Saprospiraceae bacterium]
MKQQPHIIFAGAGPGDPDLVTMKLVECLKTCECILVDRLVNPEILRRYASQTAEIIFVGKQAYQKESTDQADINKLLIAKAMIGLKTLRLKGGDVAIYSNVFDEIKAISDHGITYEIIPGITTASGAVASLGIGLTGRGVAPGVQYHSMSVTQPPGEVELKHWALTEDTLVFYMSTAALKLLTKKLLEYGASPEKPLVIIEDATSPMQQNHFYTLFSLAFHQGDLAFKSPSIIIIGDILQYSLQSAQEISPDAHTLFEPINSITKNISIHVI